MQNKENLKPEMENEILSNEKIKRNAISESNTRKINSKERTKKLRLAFMKTSLMAMLLIVSTYAWFTSQKDITISNLRGTVEVAENMEISLDAKTWHQEIDLSDANTIFEAAQTSKDATVTGTAKALLPVQMLPVSGIGELGLTTMPLYGGKAKGTSLTEIGKYLEVDGANRVDNGYYAFDIYVKNTSKDGADDVLQLNLNSAVQVLTQSVAKLVDGNELKTYTGDAASGLQNTIRVGLALYGKKEADGTLTGITTSTATQEEILNATKNAIITDIAIWEPNAKDHVEYIVANNNKLINETETNKIEFTTNQQVDTYALTADSVSEGAIENVYDISSAGLGLQKTFRTEKTSTSDYRILSTNGKPLNIKSIQTESGAQKDFKITSNTVTRLRVYVWLEGQDIDCINIASQGGGIELDLGLTKDDEIGDVLTQGDLNLQASYELTGPSEVKVTVRSTQELNLPEGWNYEETATATQNVYRVASVENVRLATETTINKKSIQKTFTTDVEENLEITSLGGVKDRLQLQIINVASGNPCMVRTKYSTVKDTTGNVTITIISDKQIAELPDGWTYVDTSTKKEIYKDYSQNTTEDVIIKDAEGNEVTTEVKVENIVEDTEGSGGTESTTTLADVTKENIGDYIDLGKNIIKTSATNDDWRIFYTDGSTVYAILADYLPALQVPRSTGLNTNTTNYPYSIWSNIDRDTLVNGLLNQAAWNSFANGITGATVTGSPTKDLFWQSYNTKNNKSSSNTSLSSSTEDYDLYVPHTESIADYTCHGYWLASPREDDTAGVWFVDCSGGVHINLYEDLSYGGRPLVSLPSNIPVTKEGDIWTIVE